MENEGNATAAPRAALVFKKERREAGMGFVEEGMEFMRKESPPQSPLNRKKSKANHPHTEAWSEIIPYVFARAKGTTSTFCISYKRLEFIKSGGKSLQIRYH